MSLGKRYPVFALLLAGLFACALFVAFGLSPSANGIASADETDEEDVTCVASDDEEQIEDEDCGADLGVGSEDDIYTPTAGKIFTLTADLNNFSEVEAEDWELSLWDYGRLKLLSLKTDNPDADCEIEGGEGTCRADYFEADSSMVVTAKYRARSAGRTSVEALLDHGSVDSDEEDNAYEWDVKIKSPAKAAKCVVPKLKGVRVKSAKAKLKRARCGLGSIKGAGKVKGKALGRLKVKSTKPGAGKKLKAGAKVKLVVTRR